MGKIKLLAILFSFVLMLPVMVVSLAFVFEDSEEMSELANYFDLQEEEEDSEESEEEKDDNESKKIVVERNTNLELSNWNSKQFYSKVFVNNTLYLPGVPSPPPELS